MLKKKKKKSSRVGTALNEKVGWQRNHPQSGWGGCMASLLDRGWARE